VSRRHDLRRIKRSHCYSAVELASLLKVNIGTIRRWCMEGLRPIDSHRPYLFHGEQVAAFLESRIPPKISLGPGELLCVTCRTARPSRGGFVAVEPRGPTTVNFVGRCATCGRKMVRRVRIAEIAEKLGTARIASGDEIATISSGHNPDQTQSFEELAA
jgi:hypothetical protein